MKKIPREKAMMIKEFLKENDLYISKYNIKTDAKIEDYIEKPEPEDYVHCLGLNTSIHIKFDKTGRSLYFHQSDDVIIINENEIKKFINIFLGNIKGTTFDV